MEPNENQLSSYFQHPTTATTATGAAATTTPSPTNGLFPNTHSTDGSHMVYSHSVPSSAVTSPLEPPPQKEAGAAQKVRHAGAGSCGQEGSDDVVSLLVLQGEEGPTRCRLAFVFWVDQEIPAVFFWWVANKYPFRFFLQLLKFFVFCC
ncbi:hypothetical protein ACFX19_034178 [Malus domestica]